MPENQVYLLQAERELATGREAARIGNEGKARVCARRAAGQAIAWFLSRHPRPAWRNDAMDQLLHLKDDPEFPRYVRDAATRLTTRITPDFTYPSEADPLADAKSIIDHITSIMGYIDDR